MWSLLPLLLAVYASTHERSTERATVRELAKRLGLSPARVLGVHHVDGVPVLRFADGSTVVRLESVESFVDLGVWLDSVRYIGSLVNGPIAWGQYLSGDLIVFVLLDPRGLPLLVMELWMSPSDGGWTPVTYNELRVLQRAPDELIDDPARPDGPLEGVIDDHELMTKALAFYLDLQPMLAIDEARIVSAVEGQKLLGDIVKDFEQRFIDMRPYDLEHQWATIYEDYRKLLFGQLEPDEDEDEILQIYRHANITLIGAVNQAFNQLTTPVFRRLYAFDHLSLKRRLPSLTKGVTDTGSIRLPVSVPGTMEYLLGLPSHTIAFIICRPSLQWMHEHRSSMGDDYPFDERLVCWRLEDSEGRIIDEVSFEMGPYELLRRHLDLNEQIQEDLEDVLEGADQVQSSTPRQWLVPLDEVLVPQAR